MVRQRLTRAEKSALTRAELMASARALFLRRGFHAASLELVAEGPTPKVVPTAGTAGRRR